MVGVLRAASVAARAAALRRGALGRRHRRLWRGRRGRSLLGDAVLRQDDGSAGRRRAGDGPAPRAGAELIADPARGRLLLFGGRDADGALRDLWELRLFPA